MATAADQDLSNQLDHLIKATESPPTITASAGLSAALGEGRQRCVNAKTALDAASKAVDDDQTENKAVAIAFTNALSSSVGELSYLAGRLRSELLNLRPEDQQAVGEVEMSNRRMFISSNLDLAPSDIAAMSRAAAVNKLRTIHDRLAPNPAYVPPALLAPFTTKVAALEDAQAAVIAESLDDQPLYATLVSARVEAQSCRVAFRELISAVLRFEHGALDVDAFLLKARKARASADEPAPVPQPG
jgi:hypothetical protein